MDIYEKEYAYIAYIFIDIYKFTYIYKHILGKNKTLERTNGSMVSVLTVSSPVVLKSVKENKLLKIKAKNNVRLASLSASGKKQDKSSLIRYYIYVFKFTCIKICIYMYIYRHI
jgi:hypothetical protein